MREPNGSGKTTLFRTLAKEHSPGGVFNGELFVNADAVRGADRAYLFDNSTESHVLLAEAAGGKFAAVHVGDGETPSWFRRLRTEIET